MPVGRSVKDRIKAKLTSVVWAGPGGKGSRVGEASIQEVESLTWNFILEQRIVMMDHFLTRLLPQRVPPAATNEDRRSTVIIHERS